MATVEALGVAVIEQRVTTIFQRMVDSIWISKYRNVIQHEEIVNSSMPTSRRIIIMTPNFRSRAVTFGIVVASCSPWANAAWVQTSPTASDEESVFQLRLDARLRYNNIVQSNRPDRLNATTLRVVPGIDLKLRQTLRLNAEIIHTDYIGAKRSNENPAVPSTYPLLPDPRYTGINRATLTWTANDDLEVALALKR